LYRILQTNFARDGLKYSSAARIQVGQPLETIRQYMKVGDLAKKKSTGQACLIVEHAPAKYGNAWIKVIIDGRYSKWVNAYNYEVLK